MSIKSLRSCKGFGDIRRMAALSVESSFGGQASSKRVARALTSREPLHGSSGTRSRRRYQTNRVPILSASAVVLPFFLAACTGQVGESITAGDSNAPNADSFGPTNALPGGRSLAITPGAGPAGDSSCAHLHPGRSPMRRMTNEEYNTSIRELFADTSNPASAFPGDSDQYGFSNNADASMVSQDLVGKLRDAAETIATKAVSDVGKLTGCPSSGDDACAQTFLQNFGKRMYRRPVTTEEQTQLMGVYQAGKQTDFATGIRLALQVMLQVPSFLYRLEFGQPVAAGDQVQHLTPYETASRLGFLFWGGPADNTLLAAADANQLSTPQQIETQARRMLQDSRAQNTVESFHMQWLQLTSLSTIEKDAQVYPSFNGAVRTAMVEETRRFIDHVIFQDDAKLTTLLSANYSFLNNDLASLYGVSPPGSSDFVKTTLDPTQRAGILTQAAVLATHAKLSSPAPVLRGKMIRTQLFCQNIPPPPPNVPPPPPPSPTLTTRERFSEHSTNAACASCHHKMDPIGFMFEKYDGIGAWRTSENGKPIDDSGSVQDTTDVDGAYTGAVQLAKKLSTSQEVSDCVVTQWFQFATGRLASDEDACSLALLKKAFATSGGDIRELLIALTQTDAFLYRPASNNGGTQ